MRVVLGCNSISQTFESFYHQMKKFINILRYFFINYKQGYIYIYISVSNEDNKYTLLNFHDFQQEQYTRIQSIIFFVDSTPAPSLRAKAIFKATARALNALSLR